MSTTKLGRAKKLKHPLFVECAAIEPIIFWKSLFEGCAYGNFPKGTVFKNGVMYYRKGKKKQSVGIPISENPKDALIQVKDIFRSEIGLLSGDETSKAKVEIYRKLKETKLPDNAVWKNIRAPTVKQLMIHIFVMEVRKEMRLTDYEAEQLNSCIVLALITGQLESDDMILDAKNGRLGAVAGLKKGAQGFYIERPLKSYSVKFEKAQNDQKQVCAGSTYATYAKRYAVTV
jgi:hypothetical protein